MAACAPTRETCHGEASDGAARARSQPAGLGQPVRAPQTRLRHLQGGRLFVLYALDPGAGEHRRDIRRPYRKRRARRLRDRHQHDDRPPRHQEQSEHRGVASRMHLRQLHAVRRDDAGAGRPAHRCEGRGPRHLSKPQADLADREGRRPEPQRGVLRARLALFGRARDGRAQPQHRSDTGDPDRAACRLPANSRRQSPLLVA